MPARNKVMNGGVARKTKIEADLAAAADDKAKAAVAKAQAALDRTSPAPRPRWTASARTTRRWSDSRSRCSSCATPAYISIPLGFLAVIVGSLLYRDKRAEDMWDELYARQNTGILAAKAVAH